MKLEKSMSVYLSKHDDFNYHLYDDCPTLPPDENFKYTRRITIGAAEHSGYFRCPDCYKRYYEFFHPHKKGDGVLGVLGFVLLAVIIYVFWIIIK